jgi:hypothetical protein
VVKAWLRIRGIAADGNDPADRKLNRHDLLGTFLNDLHDIQAPAAAEGRTAEDGKP